MVGEKLGKLLRLARVGLVLSLKSIWLASMVLVPLVGMWLSSSLAAYYNSSIAMCIAFGLLLFPVIPFAWDQFYLWRQAKKGEASKRILTTADRLVLRTLSINLVFIVGILSIAPMSAFRSSSTRGDWMFDGHDGPISNGARSFIFGLAEMLEGRWDPGESVYGESDEGPEEPDSRVDPPVPDEPGTEPGPKEPVVKAQEIKEDIPLKLATEHWPLKAEIHSLVRDMPESVQSRYQDVAQYLLEQFDDPFERTRAIHDYITLRLHYDSETRDRIMAGQRRNLPSQRPKAVFDSGDAVCEGYARLMRAMGKEAKLNVAYIVGKARFQMKDSEGVGHAWNAVNIGDAWYLMDVTWDDGTMEENGHGYQTTYLNTPPELFGVDHFPDKASWQLLESPLSIGEFMRQPDLRPDFALYDFELISPTRSQVSVSETLEMSIGNPRGAYILAQWNSLGDSGEQGKCEVESGNPIEVRCDLPSEGEYQVMLFGNNEASGRFGEIATQLVNRR